MPAKVLSHPGQSRTTFMAYLNILKNTVYGVLRKSKCSFFTLLLSCAQSFDSLTVYLLLKNDRDFGCVVSSGSVYKCARYTVDSISGLLVWPVWALEMRH